MGFYEDDRIRNKNFVSNKANEIYGNYRDSKWSPGDIAAAAEDELRKDPSNKVAYEVLKMALRYASDSVPMDSTKS